ncbi:MAG: hypothetical protein ACK6CU_23270 [Deltaproteobacteria bacterium]|jgi:hypothetical protein
MHRLASTAAGLVLLLLASSAVAQRGRDPAAEYTLSMTRSAVGHEGEVVELPVRPIAQTFQVVDTRWSCTLNPDVPLAGENLRIFSRRLDCSLPGTDALVSIVASCCGGTRCARDTQSGRGQVALRTTATPLGTSVSVGCRIR